VTGPITRAAVVGATAWGTMLAVLLARNGVVTMLVTRTEDEAARLESDRENVRRLPGTFFPEAMHAAVGPPAIDPGVDLVCFVVPSHTLEANALAIAAAVPGGATLLSAAKGIDGATGRRMSEVLTDVLPDRPVAALSGPNLSREVADGLPGATVVASPMADLDALRVAFHSATFRVYTSRDIIGVELGGALKNIVAIAAGMVDAFHYGDNAKASIITRGLAEMTRLGVAAGADGATFLGLAGVGDAIATSYSPLSRNRRLGELLAGGASLDDALVSLDETAEGAKTVPAALGLAERLGVEMPITRGLHAILYEGVSPRAAVEALLGRAPKDESGA
jgi:glycerol-3-phosphate dehydrogenase (NAD(P)+)